ncbi:MAG: META domain-containing protein [Bacteroidales bacterium]|jgi:heat shock protein HslJ|nr:META domain-containing protein [Bacteroidales bacterium]
MKRLVFVFLVFNFSLGYAQNKLTGKTWKVISMKEMNLQTDSSDLPLLKLTNGRISGNSSCNRLLGEYSIRRKQITFQNVGGTKMMCPEPAFSREKLFFETLSNVKSWKVKKKKLYFFNENSNCIMVLEENIE